jgi:hypothetical protein
MPRKQNSTAKAKKLAKTQVASTPVESVGPSEPVLETVLESAPVELQETVPVPQQTGGTKTKAKKAKKKAAKAAETVTETVVESALDTEAQVQTELATVTESNTETVQEGGARKIRSFKVRLPGNESFEGRFTGLTPYQAANKALSKYYRETKTPKKKIRFTIRESTRGSKRNQYTYNGQREKLKKPVEYAINDGRVITKNYKNRLTKIKKAELEALNL